MFLKKKKKKGYTNILEFGRRASEGTYIEIEEARKSRV